MVRVIWICECVVENGGRVQYKRVSMIARKHVARGKNAESPSRAPQTQEKTRFGFKELLIDRCKWSILYGMQTKNRGRLDVDSPPRSWFWPSLFRAGFDEVDVRC